MAKAAEKKFRRALLNLPKDSTFLYNLALEAELVTTWESEGGGAKTLDRLLNENGLYDKDSIPELLKCISKTEMRYTSEVVKSAVELFVAHGHSKSNLPDRLKVPCT